MQSPAEPPRVRDAVLGDIRSFLVSGADFPSPKGVALRLAELARDPDAGVADAAKLVKTDAGLTAFVLRAANAARYGSGPAVVDVQRAVVRLGMGLLRIHAIAVSVMQQHLQGRCANFDYGGFWRESLLTAVLTEALARRCDGFPREEAFALGMLGGIGRLAFATSAPDEYAVVLAVGHGDTELLAAERRIFGFDHNELTAVLLADWGVPTHLADVVYWKQDPEAGGFTRDSVPHKLAGALQLAEGMARLMFGQGDPAPLLVRAGMLDISPEELQAMAREALQQWGEWARSIDLRPGSRPPAVPDFAPTGG